MVANTPELAWFSRVHADQLRLLCLAPEPLEARVCGGRIVDGHGDLRPEHIYFNPHPVIIGCIEFNDEYRQLDILEELASLSIECELLGVDWIGDHIIGHYQKLAHDAPPSLLLDFYKTYRACVRAQVLAIRAKQLDKSHRRELRQLHDDVIAYMHLADSHAARLGPPALLVTYGLPGVGKSALASKLAETLAIEVLGTNAIRGELFADHVSPTDFDEGAYQPEMRPRAYEEMFRRAEQFDAKQNGPTARGRSQSA